MNTKEQILEAALDLFSQKGYNAVSVRDISRAVNIKESSLYYHFRNKQDIFDTLVDFCFQKAKEYFQENALPAVPGEKTAMYQGINEEQLTEIIFTTFRYFFEDTYNVRFRKLLTISQFENPKAADIYRRLFRDYPMQIQQRVFAGLMNTGEFRREPPEAVAVEFYGVIFMLIHTYDSFDTAKPFIKEHVHQFIKSYKKGTI